MKYLIYTTVCLLLSFTLSAQTPYSGSDGDGYAVATLELAPVAAIESLTPVVKIHPNPARPGAVVNLQTEGVRTVALVSPEGRCIPLSENAGQFAVPETAPGYYTLRIDHLNGRRIHAKFLIVR